MVFKSRSESEQRALNNMNHGDKVTPIVLNLFENTVDPDQMASDEAI